MSETINQRFWRTVTLFAYRRWAPIDTFKPTGIPGNRDPSAICTAYAPRDRELSDFRDCEGDGHYLCKECCHLSEQAQAMREETHVRRRT